MVSAAVLMSLMLAGDGAAPSYAPELDRANDLARARCEADPEAVVNDARVAAYDGLRVNCHPPRRAPPCISEAFFHSRSSKGVNWLGEGKGPKDFAVCRQRRRYEDWPTSEPHVPASARPGDGHTKRAEDIFALIGPARKVLVIGASTAKQFHEAALCSLASAPGNFTKVRGQFEFWFRNKYRQASGGCTRKAAAASCARRNLTASPRSPICEHYMLSDKCFSNGTAFARTLNRYDLVIAAFDPQHYGGSHISTKAWTEDMTFLFLELSRWKKRHAGDLGKAAFVREGSALHFVGGEYKKPPKFQKVDSAGPRSTCLCAHADERSWAHKNPSWQTTVQLNLVASRNPNVHVLPFYNLTLPRDDMHKGDMCSYRMRRVNGVATPADGAAAAAKPAAGAAEEEEEVGFRGGESGGGDKGVFRRELSIGASGELHGFPALALPDPRSNRQLRGVRPIRACCDCLHMCYSPAFYDQTFFTPMWHTLVQKHGYRP
ncbi:hypothetical protein T492DRAFT_1089079 [Pavlovales sp. CCMP2436]|nr:hypothetical protein T492DRAFT_1089079 [Pavlovales sp. CCMP2436]|mmetsp:Transcript_15255/g.38665  ORF Transcript_15255/g.38665 Transcript_15255/m.38665 type:complete len:490 (+) Transcript_15255:41-1510(+)